VSTDDLRLGRRPWQVAVAGALVGAQALVGIAVAAWFAVLAFAQDGPVNGAVLGEAGYFLVMGAGLLTVGVGLVLGRRWARTPAIVTQLLLLPFVYSLLGGSRQLLLGLLAGAIVLSAFLLLISEPSREWAMDRGQSSS
jgi:hypothetical protein